MYKAEKSEKGQILIQNQAVFTLSYKDLIIGILSVKGGEWMFEYSDEFRRQNQVLPLVNFPHKDKIYHSTQLWPFFASRIPSIKQPTVQEIVLNKKIDAHNEVQMLSEFGKRTITNPFLLVPLMPQEV